MQGGTKFGDGVLLRVNRIEYFASYLRGVGLEVKRSESKTARFC